LNPDEVDDALDEIKELMEWEDVEDTDELYCREKEAQGLEWKNQ
jgi:hypothetical protein